ncbi:MAG: phosphatase PAP2 family protein [Bdellovibrionia bacterium]
MSPRSLAAIKSVSKTFALPIFVNKENKNPVVLAFGSIAFLLYILSNHFHWFTPQLLPMSWLDNAVPFIPLTVWIYISEYLFFVAVVLTCKDMINLNKYIYSIMGLQTVSVLIFTIWPTTYPRDLFPLTHDLDYLTYFAFNTLRSADTPASCCPSLHVSSVYLSSFIFIVDQRGKFPFFFIWGTLIALSTLTTKQHYAIDVVTGLIMAVITYWIFHKLISYYPANFSLRRAKKLP